MSDQINISDQKQTTADKKPDGDLVKNLLVAITAAAVGFIIGLVNDIRKTKLDFVNSQIEKLYGPLYALNEANGETWRVYFLYQWKHVGAKEESTYIFDDRYPPTPAQVQRWRNWMKTVFQPQNAKMEEIILANSHLFIGGGMPKIFKILIAHTEAYKAVISTWRDGELDACEKPNVQSGSRQNCPMLIAIRNTAVGLNFPGKELSACIASDYLTLKKYQQNLIYNIFEVVAPTRVARSPDCDREAD